MSVILFYCPQSKQWTGAFFMQLKPESLEKLKLIMRRDYGVNLSDEEANRLGFSLLKLSRLAMTALNQAEEKYSMARSITT